MYINTKKIATIKISFTSEYIGVYTGIWKRHLAVDFVVYYTFRH